MNWGRTGNHMDGADWDGKNRKGQYEQRNTNLFHNVSSGQIWGTRSVGNLAAVEERWDARRNLLIKLSRAGCVWACWVYETGHR